MIAVKLEGRLGNQLFQYAFAYATAKKLNTGFYLDKSVAAFIPAKYFDLEQDFLAPLDHTFFSVQGFKNLFSIKLKRAFYNRLQKILFGKRLITIDNRQPLSQALSQLKDGYIYEGYFQSVKYFENVKDELRQMLKVKQTYRNQFDKLAAQLPARTKKIVLHIRRGDYLGLNWSLPLSYYKKALEAAAYQQALCIFISDDPGFVEQEFGYVANKYVSNQPEIIDLQFLMMADVCILSGSSFSWWGAWLNTKAHKQVFAPKKWLGFAGSEEYPAGISESLDFNWIEF